MTKTLIGERPVRGTDTTWLAQGNKHHHSWEINGSKGSLRYNSERMNELEWYDGTSADNRRGFRTLLMGPAFPAAAGFLHMPGVGMSYSDGMVIELKDFVAAIAGESTPNALFLDGLQVVRITEAALRSGRDERWVEL